MSFISLVDTVLILLLQKYNIIFKKIKNPTIFGRIRKKVAIFGRLI